MLVSVCDWLQDEEGATAAVAAHSRSRIVGSSACELVAPFTGTVHTSTCWLLVSISLTVEDLSGSWIGIYTAGYKARVNPFKSPPAYAGVVQDGVFV